MSNVDMNNKNLWVRFKSVPLDNPFKTMLITIGICLVASVFVTFPSLKLKPIQKLNELNEKRINILQVAGIYDSNKSIDALFEGIEARVVDLRTGRFTTDVDTSYSELKGLKEDRYSRKLSADEDIASIRRQSYYQVVYLVKSDKGYSKVIIPIHGYGLWSTLYGFMSVGMDGNTIKSLKFYSHQETPGLGGEVDNPLWQKQWVDKKIRNSSGVIAISVVKGRGTGDNQVDALSGATLTSVGVNNLVQFWVGKHGFESFLQYIARGGLK